MKYILLFFSIIISIQVSSQNQKDFRDSLTVKLTIDSRNSFTTVVEPSPYFIDKNELQIYPGEIIYIEIELKKRTILSMKVVEENKNPERTILISFDQNTRLQTHQGMNFRVTNPFDYDIKCKAEMMDMNYIWKKIKPFRFKSQKSNYSILPEPMVSLLLSDFKFR